MSLGDFQQANPQAVDYIDFGLRNGISAPRMLALYRESGHAIRTSVFMEQWRNRRAMHARKATA